MYEGCKVELIMDKMIVSNKMLDENMHQCKILRYDPEEDYIRLQLEKEELQNIELDAKYRCNIINKTEVLTCMGVIKQRFRDEDGNIMIFKIENGFYSNNKTKER